MSQATPRRDEDPADILIVDDLEEKLIAYRAVLEELGENLVLARSGSEALRAVLERDFAVILLDVNMPDIDGIETAELIRRHPKTAHIPIIFITAYADEMQTARGYSLGAVDYILSPVVPEVLRTKVRVFAELSRMQRRTQALAEERVALAKAQAAQAAAEEANHRKDQFLAMLSHELRNPLAPVRSAIEVIRRLVPGDARLVWACDAVDRQVTHMTRLVDELLDVSRITHNKIVLKKDSVELGKVVRQAIETTRPALDARSHRLSVTLPPSPIWLSGDFERLCQIFGNLLSNAAKYTAEGGTIHIGVTAREGEAEVFIRDNGLGIEAELLPKIFDLFVQGERGLDRSQGGLGIGLTVVHHLVALHGGKVRAASAGRGRGAEFTVSLPCITPVGDRSDRPAAIPLAASEAPRRRVLVVDDNPDAAKAAALFLQLAGHEVKTVGDGLQALASAQVFAPEVVILDLGLPGMDGYEVAARLRKLRQTRDALMIAVSGYGQKENRSRAEAAGFHHYFVKPGDPQALQEAIAAFWNKQAPERDGEAAARA